jgi:hypothetical protein
MDVHVASHAKCLALLVVAAAAYGWPQVQLWASRGTMEIQNSRSLLACSLAVTVDSQLQQAVIKAHDWPLFTGTEEAKRLPMKQPKIKSRAGTGIRGV